MKYITWNDATLEKSLPIPHASLAAAIAFVAAEIALYPRDNDYDGWRIQDLSDDREMTLAEAMKAAHE